MRGLILAINIKPQCPNQDYVDIVNTRSSEMGITQRGRIRVSIISSLKCVPRCP